MGTWSEDIFGNDMACDVRDAYRERIKTGDKPDVALKQVKKAFAEELRDGEDKRVIYIALAAAQLEAGEVTNTIRNAALEAIVWCEHPNRDPEDYPFGLEALVKLREKLGGKPPPPRKPPKPKVPPGTAGEVYALALPEDGFVAKELATLKLKEAVIFVGDIVVEGNRGPGTGRVVVLQDLKVEDVTPESVAVALSAWRQYYQKWPDGYMGRGIFCYDATGKLPARKTRLLLRGIQMPGDVAGRMKSLGAVYNSTVLPFVVDRDLWEWENAEWTLDPDEPD